MSKFLSSLVVRKLAGKKDKANWEVIEPLIYESKLLKRVITVPKGFVTDFASVPRLPIAYSWAGNIAQASATVHDLLYQKHEISKTRADMVFLEAMKAEKVPFLKRQIMYWAVSVAGWGAYGSGPDRFKVLNS